MQALRQDPTQRQALDALMPADGPRPAPSEDQAGLEAALMNSAQAYKPIIGALDLDELRQQRNFWNYHGQSKLSPEVEAERQNMLNLLAERLAELEAPGRTASQPPARTLTPSETELFLDPTK